MGSPVDTLTIYQRLKSARLQDEAAKEIAEVIKDVTEFNLVTKVDLETTEANLKKAIEITRADLEKAIEITRADLQKAIEITRADLGKAIEKTKAETIKWVAGMLVAQAAIVATIVKLL